ncbi:unnamed protein product [Parajaminaea phylloscopi]
MNGTDVGKKRKSKASPSDVMFGQPPGLDEAVQHLGSLSSDSSPPSRNVSRPTSRRGSFQAKRTASSSSVFAAHNSTASLTSARSGAPAVATPTSMRSSPVTTSTSSPTSPTSAGRSNTAADLPEAAKVAPGDVINGVKVLPTRLDEADEADIINLVADMLSRLMVHNDNLPLDPSALTRFHSRATPAITIQSYLRRIARYTSLDKACTMILLVYIDRVCERMKGFTICSLTVHRFVCAAVVCASKALCDAFSTNGHYARVGGISLVELNMLEKEFLSIIGWHLTCSGALLQHYYTSLVGSHPNYMLDPYSSDAEGSSSRGGSSRSSYGEAETQAGDAEIQAGSSTDADMTVATEDSIAPERPTARDAVYQDCSTESSGSPTPANRPGTTTTSVGSTGIGMAGQDSSPSFEDASPPASVDRVAQQRARE